jgi:replication initiation and membrane attachment protein
MGYDYGNEINHINFGLVLKDGKKMSTRGGGVVKLYDVLEMAMKLSYEQIITKNPNIENPEEIARKVGCGAVVFNDLKNHRTLDYDFDLLLRSLPEGMFNERCLNKTMKELIINLSFLYDIDPVSMADIIRASLNEKGNIVQDELRKNTRKYYQFNNDNRLPSLVFKNQPEYLKSADGDNSNRGKIIKVFENYSPYEFLKNKNKGVKPTDRDMKILEELIIDMQLKPAVVNVLIDYTLKTNNNKLVKAYIETIAGQWQRLKIETVDDAMKTAEKEHKKYKTPLRSSTTTQKKIIKEEKLPEWFDKKIDKKETSKEEIQKMQDLLKEYR